MPRRNKATGEPWSARGGDASWSRRGQEAAGAGERRQARHAAKCGDELGEALEAGVRHRHPGLCTLRRVAQGHCQHRGARSYCEDSGAPGAYGTGAGSVRVAAGCEGTTGVVHFAVNLMARSACCRWTMRQALVGACPDYTESGKGRILGGGQGGVCGRLAVRKGCWPPDTPGRVRRWHVRAHIRPVRRSRLPYSGGLNFLSAVCDSTRVSDRAIDPIDNSIVLNEREDPTWKRVPRL
jgi:hypothetical protein